MVSYPHSSSAVFARPRTVRASRVRTQRHVGAFCPMVVPDGGSGADDTLKRERYARAKAVFYGAADRATDARAAFVPGPAAATRR